MDRADILNRLDLETAVQKAYDGLVHHDGPGTRISWEYGCHIAAPDPDDVDPRHPGIAQGFRRFAAERARKLVMETVDQLADAIDVNDGTFCIYRGLLLPRDTLDTGLGSRPIGVCWSWHYDFAIPHHAICSGKDEIEVRLLGLINADNVDWTETVALNASQVYVTGEEREIRLKPDAMIEIAGLDWRETIDGPWVTDDRYETTGLALCASFPGRHLNDSIPAPTR